MNIFSGHRIQFLSTWVALHFAISLFLTVLSQEVAAEEKAAADKVTEENGSEKKGKDEVQYGLTGLLLGRLSYIDPQKRMVYVKPLKDGQSRRTFYLDRRTIYRREKARIKWEDLTIGKKVGIRYLSERGLSLAEGVFLIPGEVELAHLQMPKKKPTTPPAGAEKKAEGGHGAAKPAAPAKPAAKKSGGGH